MILFVGDLGVLFLVWTPGRRTIEIIYGHSTITDLLSRVCGMGEQIQGVSAFTIFKMSNSILTGRLAAVSTVTHELNGDGAIEATITGRSIIL
jgi:hypothetical protein